MEADRARVATQEGCARLYHATRIDSLLRDPILPTAEKTTLPTPAASYVDNGDGNRVIMGAAEGPDVRHAAQSAIRSFLAYW